MSLRKRGQAAWFSEQASLRPEADPCSRMRP